MGCIAREFRIFPSLVGRMAYSEAALLMASFHNDPPMHVLTAMRYGFYEARKKEEDAEMFDPRTVAAMKAAAGRVKTFDQLPPAIQQRQMERIRKKQQQKKK